MTEFDTLAVHAGEEADPTTGALRLPLHMATTFKLPGFGVKAREEVNTVLESLGFSFNPQTQEGEITE